MRYLFTCILIILSYHLAAAGNELDSLFKALDENIRNHQQYIDQKERRISDLKRDEAKKDISPNTLFQINKLLTTEYNAYMSDSAIHYLNKNLDLAYAMNDIEKINETSISLSLLLTSLSLYKESTDVLENVISNDLDQSQLCEYYRALKNLYGGLSLYTQDKRNGKRYSELYEAYQDSLLKKLDDEDEEYLRVEEMRFRRTGKIQEALQVNDKRLQLSKPGISGYALIAFHRYLLYKSLDDMEMQKKYLILSALTDIERSNRDNAALSNLANILFQEGDIDRSYKYIRFSLDNANDYNTKLRRTEILNTQGIIDKTYQKKNEQQRQKLRSNLILISILSVLLICALIYIYRQMKKLSVTSHHIKEVNEQLNELNQIQNNMNIKLRETNTELSEANHIKEEYIGHFLNICSAYIDKLDEYRKTINKKLTSGQTAELIKMTKAGNLRETELEELYTNFDHMFLDLYPDFVEEFNHLLLENEKIIPKKGELLNTELRIFALIRLGIEDSSKIAKFLGYSVNTIYNYRAKVKNKTRISRDDFEITVRKIGNVYFDKSKTEPEK